MGIIRVMAADLLGGFCHAFDCFGLFAGHKESTGNSGNTLGEFCSSFSARVMI